MLSVDDMEVTLDRGGTHVTLTGPISFDVAAGEVFGLVGESGSGKSMAALALMRLTPRGTRVGGHARLDGRDLVAAPEREMRRVRGAGLSMVFQEPAAALNPVFTVGAQLVAAIRAHAGMTRRAARARAAELLATVGISDPARRLREYPHQLSGGMCQRVMIAMALAAGSRLLIADEPTTALDVTIQEQILTLIERLVATTGLSVLFISHDLGVVARLCDRVAVLYASEIVESGGAALLLRAPLHPYTRGLVRCVADLTEVGVVRRGIPGQPPPAGTWPSGCRFRPRCPFAVERCRAPQDLRPLAPGHLVRCCRAGELKEAAA